MLREMFTQFALFGASASQPALAQGRIEMDGARFQKLCRECQLFDRSSARSSAGFNPTRADLIFTKVKQQVRVGGACASCFVCSTCGRHRRPSVISINWA
jgi:hypothetical protein